MYMDFVASAPSPFGTVGAKRAVAAKLLIRVAIISGRCIRTTAAGGVSYSRSVQEEQYGGDQRCCKVRVTAVYIVVPGVDITGAVNA